MMNKLFLISAFILSITCVSALQLDMNAIDINKTYEETYSFNLSVMNDENSVLYNISLISDDYSGITSSMIDSLPIGSNGTITVTVTSNENLDISLRLKSYYYRNFVPDYKIYEDIISSTSIEYKDFKLDIGDTITFVNNYVYAGNPTSIYINRDGFTEFILGPNQTKAYQFTTESDALYDISIYGNDHVATRQIYVIPNSGYVNDPTKDLTVNVNLTTIYKTTTTSHMIPISNYSMKFYEEQDGFITISNTGAYTAKTVHLESEWITFAVNNFDLASGYTKNIAYTIKPENYIRNTNETNQKYIKSIFITGNFDKIIIPVTIFIEYSEIADDGTSSGKTVTELFEEFCLDNPEICSNGQNTVYVGNNSDNMFNATLGEKQLQRIFTTILSNIETSNRTDNYWKEQFYLFQQQLNQSVNDSSTAKEAVTDIRDSIETNNSIWIFFGLIFGAILICGLLVYLAYYYKKQNLLSRFTGYGK